MKNIFVSFSLILSILIENSCTKTEDQTISIVGKWKIVNDTSSYESPMTGLPVGSNYIGKPNDYFDFISDGNLYYKEDAIYLREKYNMVASNQVQFFLLYENGYSYYGTTVYSGFYMITNLTEHTATLSQSSLSPDGYIWQMINLKK